ncbi:hypothetical protein [Rhizobium etli]|uniref:hypothetical protein n=1 Tax=Rhizobium etli TaxID=29449 RepID=UPI0012DB7127|nr:hypothetical protein [Rhizobium etli]
MKMPATPASFLREGRVFARIDHGRGQRARDLKGHGAMKFTHLPPDAGLNCHHRLACRGREVGKAALPPDQDDGGKPMTDRHRRTKVIFFHHAGWSMMPEHRVELKNVVQEIWGCEAENEEDAELNWMVKPESFIFDCDEIEQHLVKVYKVEP